MACSVMGRTDVRESRCMPPRVVFVGFAEAEACLTAVSSFSFYFVRSLPGPGVWAGGREGLFFISSTRPCTMMIPRRSRVRAAPCLRGSRWACRCSAESIHLCWRLEDRTDLPRCRGLYGGGFAGCGARGRTSIPYIHFWIARGKFGNAGVCRG